MSMQQTFREQNRAAQRPQQEWQEDYGQNRQDNRLPSLPMAGNPDELANGLGWFSIALGLAQLVAPRQVAQLIGVDEGASQAVMRAVGLRELASGLGILSQPSSQRANWIKARVGGDVMDLALLGKAYVAGGNDQTKVTTALVAVAGITALDLFCSQQLDSQQSDSQQSGMGQDGAQYAAQQSGPQMKQQSDFRSGEDRGQNRRDPGRTGQRQQESRQIPVGKEEKGIHVVKAVTINRPPEELYQFWHNFENLPRFMSHVQSVQTLDDRRSHWKVNAPANMSVEWDAEIIDDQPNRRIAWQSLPDAGVRNAGSVRFEPANGGRGTRVTVELQYEPPLGKLGATVAKLLGEEPEKQVYDELRAFKQVMELGEVTRSDGSLWGPQLAQRPAQPPSEEELRKHADAAWATPALEQSGRTQ
jgi:uncharacterized membrane protein